MTRPMINFRAGIKPGELYSKDKVVRTVRELGQLGFFDAEQISPDFKNVDPNAEQTDINFTHRKLVLPN